MNEIRKQLSDELRAVRHDSKVCFSAVRDAINGENPKRAWMGLDYLIIQLQSIQRLLEDYGDSGDFEG